MTCPTPRASAHIPATLATRQAGQTPEVRRAQREAEGGVSAAHCPGRDRHRHGTEDGGRGVTAPQYQGRAPHLDERREGDRLQSPCHEVRHGEMLDLLAEELALGQSPTVPRARHTLPQGAHRLAAETRGILTSVATDSTTKFQWMARRIALLFVAGEWSLGVQE